VAPCGATDPQIVRQAIAATYGTIEMIDDAVGRILATVDALGQDDDTIVVFTSDHGDMMGDHGLFLKGFMHYRGTLQVPMVIRAPGRMPGRSASLASTLDLCPTILDLAGVDAFHGIQGRSLSPVLADPAAVVRRHVLVEDDLPSAELSGSFVPPKTRTVITDRARYSRNSKGEEQLFDLRADPDELADLSDLDDGLGRTMRDLMMDALIEADDLAREAPVA
jgi:arylsulfatase A-like enzyme